MENKETSTFSPQLHLWWNFTCHRQTSLSAGKLHLQRKLHHKSVSFLVKNNWLCTVISSVVERSPKAKQFYPCQVPTQSCHSERSEESPGKDTAYTPRRDDIQRLALMIYSHKWLMIYTASRDYGEKGRVLHFPTTTKFALADFISSSEGRFHPLSGFHPSRTDFIAKPPLRPCSYGAFPVQSYNTL